MTSHEYANRLKEIADFLLGRPEFEVAHGLYFYQRFDDKDKFVAAAKALGSGVKSVSSIFHEPEISFTPSAAKEFVITIPRDKVCRKVKDAEYECDPFFSPGELEAVLGGKA